MRGKRKYSARARTNHHSDIHSWMWYQNFSFSLIHCLDILFTLQMEVQPFLVARCVWNDPQKCGKDPQDMRGEALQRVEHEKNSTLILGRSGLLGRKYLQSQYWGRDFSCLGLGRWKSSRVLSAKYSDKSNNKNSRKKGANSIHVWIVESHTYEGSYTGESSDKDVKLSRDVWSGSDNCTGTPD